MAEHVHQACGETSAATTLVSSVGSQRREKPLQHPPGASHRASPVKFDQDGVHTQLRVAVTSTTSANRPPSWGRTACQATQRSEQGRSTRLIWRGDAGPDAGSRTLPARAGKRSAQAWRIEAEGPWRLWRHGAQPESLAAQGADTQHYW